MKKYIKAFKELFIVIVGCMVILLLATYITTIVESYFGTIGIVVAFPVLLVMLAFADVKLNEWHARRHARKMAELDAIFVAELERLQEALNADTEEQTHE